jgi:hypothetical protein
MKAITKKELHLIMIANSMRIKNPHLVINQKDHFKFRFKNRIGKMIIVTTNFTRINHYNIMSGTAYNNWLKSFKAI